MVNILDHPKIVIDTNIFIYIFKNKISVERELFNLLGTFELYTTDGVLNELKRLSKTNWEAKAALQYIEIKKLKIIKTNKNGDESILFVSKMKDTYILTNDFNLARKIKSYGGKVIITKGFKRLDFY
ncbi:MAG: PIN domain-containing protein [Thermoplasmata archaeon]